MHRLFGGEIATQLLSNTINYGKTHFSRNLYFSFNRLCIYYNSRINEKRYEAVFEISYLPVNLHSFCSMASCYRARFCTGACKLHTCCKKYRQHDYVLFEFAFIFRFFSNHTCLFYFPCLFDYRCINWQKKLCTLGI